MKVLKRIKLSNVDRVRRHRALLERIARTNDTGYSDDVVLSVLSAKSGPWSEPMTAEELLASLGIET